MENSQITIDAAFLSRIMQRVLSILGYLIGFSTMGATSGLVTGSMLKQGVENALPQTPPIIKRLLPPAAKTEAAVGRLVLPNSFCSGVIVGPVYTTDQFVDILSAGHCIREGQKGYFKLPNGTSLEVQCFASDSISDVSWLRAQMPIGEISDLQIPYLLLSPQAAAVGAEVHHCGLGRDRPGNREVGKVVQSHAGNGKTLYQLNVSPGDSGAPIVESQTGLILGPVCCTSKIGASALVWAGSPESCISSRPY